VYNAVKEARHLALKKSCPVLVEVLLDPISFVWTAM
jgi:TPP-dependent pyruvate/acetoin dehydrogenase alpha subunit